jgi:hypothetical protein
MNSYYLHELQFAGSRPAEVDGFLRSIQICSTPSFGGEVKPLAPCHILGMLKNPTSMKEILRRQISRPFLAKFPLFRY